LKEGFAHYTMHDMITYSVMKEVTRTGCRLGEAWTPGPITKIAERASKRPGHIQLGGITLWWKVSNGLLPARGQDLLAWLFKLHDPDAFDAL
jgi:hypothetical protein